MLLENLFASDIDRGILERYNLRKHYNCRNEIDKEKERSFEILMHMRKMKYVPNPEIMLNPKIPNLFPGDKLLVFQGMQKGQCHIKNMSKKKVFSSQLNRLRVV